MRVGRGAGRERLVRGAREPSHSAAATHHRHHRRAHARRRHHAVRRPQVAGVPAVDMPNRALTPGAVLTTSTARVCVTGYAASVRDVPQAEKDAVYARYGVVDVPYKHEVDHLVSLEIGGSNAIANLWPEPYAGRWGARTKDVLEDRLHELVCDGRLGLRRAQRIEAADWPLAYRRYVGGTPGRRHRAGDGRRRLGGRVLRVRRTRPRARSTAPTTPSGAASRPRISCISGRSRRRGRAFRATTCTGPAERPARRCPHERLDCLPQGHGRHREGCGESRWSVNGESRSPAGALPGDLAQTAQAVAVARASDAVMVEVSDGFCALVGRRREEIIGRTAAELGISDRERLDWLIDRFPERGRSHHQRRVFETPQGRRLAEMDIHGIEIGGERMIISVINVVPADDADPDVLGAVLDASPLGMVLYDRDLRIVRLNRAVERLGAIGARHVGMRLHEAVPDVSERVVEAIRGVFATGEPSWGWRRPGSTAAPTCSPCFR